MGRGLSSQQKQIIQILKDRGEQNPKFPWLSTRKIVMLLRPDVQAYLDEMKMYHRIARQNMMNPDLHELYLEHEKRLSALPNYHTVRTSINRALRGLVKRGIVVRQQYWGMYQKQGTSAGWLLKEYMRDEFEADSEYLELLQQVYGNK